MASSLANHTGRVSTPGLGRLVAGVVCAAFVAGCGATVSSTSRPSTAASPTPRPVDAQGLVLTIHEVPSPLAIDSSKSGTPPGTPSGTSFADAYTVVFLPGDTGRQLRIESTVWVYASAQVASSTLSKLKAAEPKFVPYQRVGDESILARDSVVRSGTTLQSWTVAWRDGRVMCAIDVIALSDENGVSELVSHLVDTVEIRVRAAQETP